MALKTKYITSDDFKEYTGIDLDLELEKDDNPSNTTDAFLYRIEVRMEAWLNVHFFKDVDDEYPKLTDKQKEHYKIALLEQALYVFKNGEISVDSGYDPERGEVIGRDTIQKLSIAPNAINHLLLTGLYSRTIRAIRGGGIFW